MFKVHVSNIMYAYLDHNRILVEYKVKKFEF